VHRAVILPLCQLLGIMEKDVTREDPTVLFPDTPLELLEAFVRIIYTGSAPVSEVVTINSILVLMRSLGLYMPDHCLIIVKEEEKVKVGEFLKPKGLDIIEVGSKSTAPPPAPPSIKPRPRSLEITPCNSEPKPLLSKAQQPQQPTPVCTNRQKPRPRQLCKNISNKSTVSKSNAANIITSLVSNKEIVEMSKEAKKMKAKMRSKKVEVDIVGKQVDKKRKRDVELGPLEIPHMKRKYNRRSETLEVLVQACKLCEFKCRFLKDLSLHYEAVHFRDDFRCEKCDFVSSSFAGLRVHVGRKHAGVLRQSILMRMDGESRGTPEIIEDVGDIACDVNLNKNQPSLKISVELDCKNKNNTDDCVEVRGNLMEASHVKEVHDLQFSCRPLSEVDSSLKSLICPVCCLVCQGVESLKDHMTLTGCFEQIQHDSKTNLVPDFSSVPADFTSTYPVGELGLNNELVVVGTDITKPDFAVTQRAVEGKSYLSEIGINPMETSEVSIPMKGETKDVNDKVEGFEIIEKAESSL